MSDCLTVWLSDCLTVWLSDCLTVWLFDCVTVWLFDCLTVWQSDCEMRWQGVSDRLTQCSKTQGGRTGHPRLRCRLAPGGRGVKLKFRCSNQKDKQNTFFCCHNKATSIPKTAKGMMWKFRHSNYKDQKGNVLLQSYQSCNNPKYKKTIVLGRFPKKNCL